jgi:hypothetical protein
MSRLLVLVALSLAACATRATGPAPAIPTPVPGDLAYRGRVQLRGPDADRLFTYERRVQRVDDGLVAVHTTFDPQDTPVVQHTAAVDAAGALQRFDEVHAQLGHTGHAVVQRRPDGDHDIVLTVTRAGRTQVRTRSTALPVHAGPSLFGFVQRNWTRLLRGERLPLRFVVLDAVQTYRFVVRLDDVTAEHAVFTMTASHPAVRLVVAPMRLTFARADRSPVRFEGLVPPRRRDGNRWRRLDARVDYTLAPLPSP